MEKQSLHGVNFELGIGSIYNSLCEMHRKFSVWSCPFNVLDSFTDKDIIFNFQVLDLAIIVSPDVIIVG